MIIVVWIFALLTALIHIVVFAWEGFLLHRPAVHEKVFSIPATDLPALRLWTFGLGFYNLFFALGLLAGVGMWMLGDATRGSTLVTYVCAALALSGAVLLIADRTGMGRVKGANLAGAFSQSLPPLVALAALALA